MAQRPKDEVREALLEAAAAAFSEVGFGRAGLADIVSRAGTSIGNLYKYFGDKDALFAAFIPAGFTRELTALVRAQVEAFRVGPEAHRRASEALLAFTLLHRERVLFLLLRAEGTQHEPFVNEVVRLLVGLAFEYAPAFAPTAANKRALARIYRAFLGTLGAILEQERSESGVRAAVASQAAYHMAGLGAVLGGRTA